jgi:hypothetical protein
MGDEKIKSTKIPNYGQDYWVLGDFKTIEEKYRQMTLETPATTVETPATTVETLAMQPGANC